MSQWRASLWYHEKKWWKRSSYTPMGIHNLVIFVDKGGCGTDNGNVVFTYAATQEEWKSSYLSAKRGIKKIQEWILEGLQWDYKSQNIQSIYSANNMYHMGCGMGNTRETQKGGRKRRYRRYLSGNQLCQRLWNWYNYDGICYYGYLHLRSLILNQWNKSEHG